MVLCQLQSAQQCLWQYWNPLTLLANCSRFGIQNFLVCVSVTILFSRSPYQVKSRQYKWTITSTFILVQMMCLSESLERTPLCNCPSWGITDEDLSLLQSTAMGGKGEAWKVLSLTHVEYKVGWRLTGQFWQGRLTIEIFYYSVSIQKGCSYIILNSLLFHRRTTRWGRCLQFIPFCLLSLSSFLLQLSLSGVTWM